jgi:NAD(P)-dependent dehydrogenase (short-subunit alcohol dehydrogenase family)
MSRLSYANLLVVGSVTGGIGREFLNSLKDDPNKQKFWSPPPDALDVTDPVSIDKFLANHMAMGFGPFQHVFYAAGTKTLGFVGDLDIESIKHTFDVNVFGFINLLQGLMKIQDSGRICVITSETSIVPMRATIGYCSSKAALAMALKVASRELTPKWHITGIMPTGVEDTPMTNDDIKVTAELRGWTEEATIEAFKVRPMGRMVHKDEVASLARWLLFHSPEAMAGSIVEMRGG